MNNSSMTDMIKSPDLCRDYTIMSCYRPDKPETVAFLYPADCIIVYNRAAHPAAYVYDLCFDCGESDV